MSQMKSTRAIFVYLVILLLVLSCATTRRYEAYVDRWKGKTSAELVAEWGPPAELKTLADHTKLYNYVRRSPLDPATKGARTTASQPVSCVTSFIVDEQDYVTGWTLSGFDCRTK
jgi:hypothetical protein